MSFCRFISQIHFCWFLLCIFTWFWCSHRFNSVQNLWIDRFDVYLGILFFRLVCLFWPLRPVYAVSCSLCYIVVHVSFNRIPNGFGFSEFNAQICILSMTNSFFLLFWQEKKQHFELHSNGSKWHKTKKLWFILHLYFWYIHRLIQSQLDSCNVQTTTRDFSPPEVAFEICLFSVCVSNKLAMHNWMKTSKWQVFWTLLI